MIDYIHIMIDYVHIMIDYLLIVIDYLHIIIDYLHMIDYLHIMIDYLHIMIDYPTHCHRLYTHCDRLFTPSWNQSIHTSESAMNSCLNEMLCLNQAWSSWRRRSQRLATRAKWTSAWMWLLQSSTRKANMIWISKTKTLIHLNGYECLLFMCILLGILGTLLLLFMKNSVTVPFHL